QVLIVKANNIFATPSNYQSKALNDIQKYADKYGLKIDDYNFDDRSEAEAGPESSSKPMTITFQNPSSYTGLIRFLDAIEGNLPKMTVSAIDLSRASSASSNNVNINRLTIEIFTR